MKLSMKDGFFSILDTIDIMDPALSVHHRQVGLLTLFLASEFKLEPQVRRDLLVAALLHDVGLLERDVKPMPNARYGHLHVKRGSGLVGLMPYFRRPADWIGLSHSADSVGEDNVPVHILQISEWIVEQMDDSIEILIQVPTLLQSVSDQKFGHGEEIVTCLRGNASLWFDLVSPLSGRIVRNACEDLIGDEEILLKDLCLFYVRLMDFSNSFTSIHSCGVAETAFEVSKLAGFDDESCHRIYMCGYLHDLGKVGISNEILDKPGKLTEEEFNYIKQHPYFTYRILEPIAGMDILNTWAAYHHERLDGQGYPFGFGEADLSVGCQLMAVADVLTALREDRTYRPGMSVEKTLGILNQMAGSALSPTLVSLAIENFDQIDSARKRRQDAEEEAAKLFRVEWS